MADNSAAMRVARRRDGDAKRRRAAEALAALVSGGESITFPAVARRAVVSVMLLYADEELARAIAEVRDRQRQAGWDRAWHLPARALVTDQSLRVDLANAKEQVRRLTEEVEILRERLTRDLGAQADLARGRFDGSLLEQLERRASELEAENSSLRPRVAALENELHDLGEDLQAARAMNRELMAGLNRASPGAESTRRHGRPANR